MEKIQVWTEVWLSFFKICVNNGTTYLAFKNNSFQSEMVTTTLCTISRKKKRCLFLSYEKQSFCKWWDCGERNCSTGWCGLIALLRETHLQDKPGLTMCSKDLWTRAQPHRFHGMGTGRAFVERQVETPHPHAGGSSWPHKQPRV